MLFLNQRQRTSVGIRDFEVAAGAGSFIWFQVALPWHARGRQFDPACLHQSLSRTRVSGIPGSPQPGYQQHLSEPS